MSGPDALAHTLDRLLDAMPSDEPGPAAGAASAAVVAVAAGVVAACARASRPGWPNARGALAQAEALQDRAAPLAQADIRAFEEASTVLHMRQAGDATIGAKLGRAAQVPLAIAGVGADVAALAAEVATRGDASFRADAMAACALAAGATQAAAHLVEVNLAVTEGDPWLDEARALARAAGEVWRDLGPVR
jgi:formiminotetrahydrofolate cyclodeaminase